jgi:predicted acetyltransferase
MGRREAGGAAERLESVFGLEGRVLKIRKYREEDQGTLAKLMVTAFGGSATSAQRYFDPTQNHRLDPDGVFVIEDDGEVRATATVLPLEMFVDGEPRPMGGVAAVTAHPAYRRRGYAGELMRKILEDLHGRNVHLSMLWPFAHAFYRAYGYELAGESLVYTFEPTDLPSSSEQKHTRASQHEDLPEMMALFERQAARHQCCVRRSEEQWRGERFWQDDEEGKSAVVYERGGGIEGYLLYQMSGWKEGWEPGRELQARELVASTPRAREALVSFMAALDPMAFEIKCATPRGEPLHPFLTNSYVKAEIEPEFMLRLVNVEGALGYLSRETGSSLVLEVSDDGIPENAGEYTVGDGSVKRGAHSEHRVSLDARQLAQLYAGYLSSGRLAEHGLIHPDSLEALERLEAMFPAGDPWVFGPDHF